MPSQVLMQMPPPNPNKDLHQQLMVQAARSSLVNYKDYQVGPEDLLVIAIYGHDDLKRELRVNGQGEITMPLVGVVKVAGLTTQEIEKRLMELYDAKYLVNPQITVSVKEFRHQQVAVTGAVDKPGLYEIIGPRTLLEVLAMAGGFSSKPKAEAGDVIHVIRHQNAPDVARTVKMDTTRPFAPHTTTTVIDLRQLVSGQAPELNITVQSGDVIHVPFAATAYVLGGVQKPGQVTVRQNLTVSQALAMAGGIDPLFGTNDITIMRFDPQGRLVRIKANLKSIVAGKDPDVPVKSSDVIVVKVGELKKTLWTLLQILPIPRGGYTLGAF
ncbi:MAG: polysaccharide export protein [Syntrophobacterales bacterium]|nr:polysaccharide export protein [Syntrophobacterales bacterium]